MRNLESDLEQQKELHKLAVQREQLQTEILKQQLKNQTEMHTKQMEREREVICIVFYGIEYAFAYLKYFLYIFVVARIAN